MAAEILHPDKWDQRFFEMCALLATWSEDRSRRVGAVIVGDANQIIATGYNGLPRGVEEIDERHAKEADEKYYWFEHAERNAIYNAARIGVSVANSGIYTNLFPCADCTRAIIQSGITKLNTFPPPNGDPRFERSFQVSVRMMAEAGLVVRMFHPRATPLPPEGFSSTSRTS